MAVESQRLKTQFLAGITLNILQSIIKPRILGILFFAAIALFFALVRPFAPALGVQGHVVISSVLFTVGLWIFGSRWVPLSIASAVMLLLFLTSGLKYNVVFTGFTSRALWILIPALYFGFALSKTGLGKRLAYMVISFFKPSYLTLTISWVIIGILLSVLTPSISVRIAIVIPIAVATLEICKIKGGTTGASFLMLAAWGMVIIPGSGWVTGALWGPLAIAYFDATPGLQGIITSGSWLKALLFPSLLLSVLFILALYVFMKPREELKIDREKFKEEYRALGPMSFAEKATLVILVITFTLLVTTQLHHLPDVAIVLGAFALLAVLGVIRAKDIGPAISWDLVIFLGSVMGLGTVFQESGLSSFLSNSLTPVIDILAVNPWLILFVALGFLFIWRFLDAAQLYATIPFLLPLLPILASNYGIHPLVVYTVFIITGNCFFLAYQQPFVVLAESVAGRTVWPRNHLLKAGVIYFVVSLISLAMSIPYWILVGLIK